MVLFLCPSFFYICVFGDRVDIFLCGYGSKSIRRIAMDTECPLECNFALIQLAKIGLEYLCLACKHFLPFADLLNQRNGSQIRLHIMHGSFFLLS